MTSGRQYEFATTPAVKTARSHVTYIPCPACQTDAPVYLFTRGGVRFVRCAVCSAVYVNPARERPLNDLDVERLRPFANPRDRELMLADTEALLVDCAAEFQRVTETPLQRTLLLGRFLRDFTSLPSASSIGLDVAELDDTAFHHLALDSDIGWAAPHLARAPQLVILNELLEGCSNPKAVVAALIAAVPATTLFAITYTNADSIPARADAPLLAIVLRRQVRVLQRQQPDLDEVAGLGYVLRGAGADAGQANGRSRRRPHRQDCTPGVSLRRLAGVPLVR